MKSRLVTVYYVLRRTDKKIVRKVNLSPAKAKRLAVLAVNGRKCGEDLEWLIVYNRIVKDTAIATINDVAFRYRWKQVTVSTLGFPASI